MYPTKHFHVAVGVDGAGSALFFHIPLAARIEVPVIKNNLEETPDLERSEFLLKRSLGLMLHDS